MKTKLQNAMKEAMKNREKEKLQTIRMLLSAIQYEEMKQNLDSLPEESVMAVLKSEMKKRRESLEFAQKDNREDIIETVKSEISTIEQFLPSQLSAEELEKIITQLKDSEDAANLGTVMKSLKENYAGQYDGKLASEIARKVL